jgi:tetratricopeptide (TPR) repeat protein
VLRPERANAWDTVAVALNRLGRYEEAVPYFTRAIELAPQLAQYYNNRAYNFVWLKQYERALADCAAALRLDPEYWAAYWWQGVAYRFLEQPGLAVEPFQRVAALLAEREPANVYHALAVLHLLIVLRESGRPTEAEPWLADATMQDADFDAWGRQLLAYCRGTVASDELLARAGDDARRISQAYCFIAERALADGQVARARDLFSRCLSAGDRRSLDCQLAAWRLAQGPVTPDGGGQ